MIKIVAVAMYITAFWNTVVVGCINPDNWKYCAKDMDVWLFPEIQRGIDLLTGREIPYQEERSALQSNKVN